MPLQLKEKSQNMHQEASSKQTGIYYYILCILYTSSVSIVLLLLEYSTYTNIFLVDGASPDKVVNIQAHHVVLAQPGSSVSVHPASNGQFILLSS